MLSKSLVVLTFSIRAGLGFLLAFDLLVVFKFARLATTGGWDAVYRWLVHVAVTGGAAAPIAQQDRAVKMMYLALAFWVLVMPLSLYLLQRWTSRLDRSLFRR